MIEATTNAATPEEDRKLDSLLSLMRSTICGFEGAINRYSIMNDRLTGAQPQAESKEQEISVSPPGLVDRLLEAAEHLSAMTNELSAQNNRLDAVVSGKT